VYRLVGSEEKRPYAETRPQLQTQEQAKLPPLLFISLNECGQLEVKTRLVLTIAEVAQALTLSVQKVYWMVYRGELPSFHFGFRRVVSLHALEHVAREREMEEQQALLDLLKRYYGFFGSGDPHPEIQRTQERLNAMQRRQGHAVPPEQSKVPVSIPAALYSITITEAGRLECTPRWLLSMQEVTQLLGLSRATLWILSKQDNFPVFHVGRRALVSVDSLLAWIRAKEQPEREQPSTLPASSKAKTSAKTAAKKTAENLSHPIRSQHLNWGKEELSEHLFNQGRQ
jgi:predicted DNA-binding transcriptional regulator AlpA